MAVNFDVCVRISKLIGYHSYVSPFLFFTFSSGRTFSCPALRPRLGPVRISYVSWVTENWNECQFNHRHAYVYTSVKIGPAFSQIFGDIWQFLL